MTQKAVAHRLGISIQTVKNITSRLYQALDVDNLAEAFIRLGWLHPSDTGYVRCGMLATCSRPIGHRGHHGGFRPLPEGGDDD